MERPACNGRAGRYAGGHDRPAPSAPGSSGCGIGRAHANAYRAIPGVELRAVCDTDTARLDAFAAEHGVPVKFADADHLLDSGEIDLVSVCTPNAFQRPADDRGVGTAGCTSWSRSRWR